MPALKLAAYSSINLKKAMLTYTLAALESKILHLWTILLRHSHHYIGLSMRNPASPIIYTMHMIYGDLRYYGH